MLITKDMYDRAQRLASFHGHEWASCPSPWDVPGYALDHVLTIEGIRAFHAPHMGDGQFAGLSFDLSHVTGTGRLTWHIEPTTTHVIVRTPGARLLALRALHGALDPMMGYNGPIADIAHSTTHWRLALAFSQLIEAELDAAKVGEDVLTAEIVTDGAAQIVAWDGAQPRHWSVLRDALRALGVSAVAVRNRDDSDRYDEGWPKHVEEYWKLLDAAIADARVAEEAGTTDASTARIDALYRARFSGGGPLL